MGMNLGGSGGSDIKSDINITPLVDVVLVLLIIFMVITPLLQMGYDVNVPPKKESFVAPPSGDQIIVRMEADGRTYINKDLVPESQFGARLRQVMAGREQKLVFFAADGELRYDRVAKFLDLCRNNGVENIGIVFDDIRATS